MTTRLEKLIEKNGTGYINGKLYRERVSIKVNAVCVVSGRTFAVVYINGDGYRTTVFYDGAEIYDTNGTSSTTNRM